MKEAVIGFGTPKRQVAGKSREIVFFVDGLPSRTLNDLPPQPVDEGESVTQPVLDHHIRLTMLPMHPHSPHCPRQRPRPYQRPPRRLYRRRHPIRASPYPPGRGMNSQTAPTAQTQDEPADTDEDDEDEDDGSDEDANSPACPIHDISCIPNYPSKSTASGLIRNGGGVEIAPCSSWTKQGILLSLLRPVYQVVFSFRSCVV